jgi:hypothetical protein
MENPGEPKMPKPEEKHDLQNTLTFQDEAGVARGKTGLFRMPRKQRTRAGEAKNK